jgi:hypothetical protein
MTLTQSCGVSQTRFDATIMEVKELERLHEEAKQKVKRIWNQREEMQRLATDKSKAFRDLAVRAIQR